MYAIIETCGKQYQIREGRYIDMELLNKVENETVIFDKIVMVVAGENSKVGQPYIVEGTVNATLLKNDRYRKIIIYKQRCKKGYRRKNGHRQGYSTVMINSIDFTGKEELLAAMPKVESV